MRGLMLVTVLVAGCGGSGQSPSERSDIPAGAKIEGTVSGGMLWLDYHENAAKASSMYQGKTLLVKIQVHSVSEAGGGFMLNGLVNLDESNRKPPGARAKFAANYRDLLARLNPGDDVWVVGRCIGKVPDASARDGVAVILESCRPATDAERPKK